MAVSCKTAGDLLLVKILFGFCICIPNLLVFLGHFLLANIFKLLPGTAAIPPEGLTELPLVWVPYSSHMVMFFSTVTQELAFYILFLAGFTGSRSYYFYTKIWQTEMTSSPIILMRLPERYWKVNPCVRHHKT